MKICHKSDSTLKQLSNKVSKHYVILTKRNRLVFVAAGACLKQTSGTEYQSVHTTFKLKHAGRGEHGDDLDGKEQAVDLLTPFPRKALALNRLTGTTDHWCDPNKVFFFGP